MQQLPLPEEEGGVILGRGGAARERLPFGALGVGSGGVVHDSCHG